MKAYKIEILVLNPENLSEPDIIDLLERTRYISVEVKDSRCIEIGEWRDDHPLNVPDKAEEEYIRLFEGEKGETRVKEESNSTVEEKEGEERRKSIEEKWKALEDKRG